MSSRQVYSINVSECIDKKIIYAETSMRESNSVIGVFGLTAEREPALGEETERRRGSRIAERLPERMTHWEKKLSRMSDLNNGRA